MKYLSTFLFSCWMIFFSFLHAADVVENLFAQGITANLKEPQFCEGILKTEHGGVITGPDFRIQAVNIVYTRKVVDKKPVFTIVAEGNFMMEFEGYFFVGDRLEYDFQTRSGTIYNGRTYQDPWYFGGEKIFLCSDGSYVIYCGYATTSENYNSQWDLSAKSLTLTPNRNLYAKNLQLRVMTIPILWIPSYKTNLDTFSESPFSYYIRWGGRLGPRAGLSYKLFTWRGLKTLIRFDYRFKRGPGGGFETHYKSENHKTTFDTINYFARDSSLEKPHEEYRYRFQGIYHTLLLNDKITVDLSYDKLSDKEMASDYRDRGIELDTAGRTQLLVRREERNWITNFFTRVRINQFQTIKQELPSLETSWRPIEIGNTGIIAENNFKAAFLDFEYGNNQLHVHDYCSTRVEYAPRFYKAFRVGEINLTPEVGAIGIYYGNSKHAEEKWLGVGVAGCNLNTRLYRHFSQFKHVIIPYMNYQYLTFPTVSPKDHYIFDIEDGWYRLNMLTFGVSQNLFFKNERCCIGRYLYTNLYANAFFDTRTIPITVPKVYYDMVFNTLPNLKHTFGSAWDFQHNQLDHINVHTQWTISSDAAIALEYRHRSAFDWRKVDHTNFIIDSFRSSRRLRHSGMSDRRDTLLIQLFYRFHPSWAIAIESRQGWNRLHEPKYTEFDVDFLATLHSGWNAKFSYQHRENDDRVAIYITLGRKRPVQKDYSGIIPSLEF